jgi:hypothetical protein
MAPGSGYTKRECIETIDKVDGKYGCQVEININAMIAIKIVYFLLQLFDLNKWSVI